MVSPRFPDHKITVSHYSNLSQVMTPAKIPPFPSASCSILSGSFSSNFSQFPYSNITPLLYAEQILFAFWKPLLECVQAVSRFPVLRFQSQAIHLDMTQTLLSSDN